MPIPVLSTLLMLQANTPFEIHIADIMLLQAKPVQTELKVTEAQRKKMNQHAQKHQSVLAELEKKYGAKKVDPATMQQVSPKLQEAFVALKRSVLQTLTPAQVRRLGEINLQRLGIAVLVDDRVATQVGMTPAQLTEFRKVYTENGQKVAKLQEDASQPIITKYQKLKPKTKEEAEQLQTKFQNEMAVAGKKIEPKVRSLEQSTAKKLQGMLTSKQTASFKKLLGKPFRPA
jgi:hypothetical protein